MESYTVLMDGKVQCNNDAMHACLVQFFVTLWTVAHQAPLSMGILQARILEWVAMPSSRRIFPTQGLNPGLPHCRQILLLSDPLGKPKNTGVGSPSLLQRILWTQRWNQGISCIAGGFFTS